MDPSKIAQITSADSFIPAVNIPAYDIGVIDNDLKITFPGSDYAAYYDGIKRVSSGDMLARWSSCCGKPV